MTAFRKNKYGAKRVTVDGIGFDSKAEARRYGELKLLQHAKEISGLAIHPRYDLTVNGMKIGTYSGDFQYFENGKLILEDVKSPATRTALYRLKKKLMKACHGIDVIEVMNAS